MKLWTVGVIVGCAGLANAQPIWTSESWSINFSSYASFDSDGGTLFSNGALGTFIRSRNASSSGGCGQFGYANASGGATQNSIFGGTSLIASGQASCTANDSSSDEPCGAGAYASSVGVAEFTITQETGYFITYDLTSYYGGSHVRFWDLNTSADIEYIETRFGGQITGTVSGVLPPGDYYMSWGCEAFANTAGFSGMSSFYDFIFALGDPPAPCPADFNQDGGIDGGDVDAFFITWEAGENAADVNRDGGVDGSDIEVFFAAWEAGGC